MSAKAGVVRSALGKWVHRCSNDGFEVLQIRPNAPARSPARPPIQFLERIDARRRDRKWSTRRIAFELTASDGHRCVCTIRRRLQRLVISRRRVFDPTGKNSRTAAKERHLGVKKVGQIRLGGGWRVRSRGSK